jgi:hypothetical protein
MTPPLITRTERNAGTEAEYLVCSYIVRACQQAIYDLALDDDRSPDVRQKALRLLKDIGKDWAEARSELRRQLPQPERKVATFTAR